MALARWKDLCLDAVDQRLVGDFWAAVGGLEVLTSPGRVSLEGPSDRHRIWVNAVDRPRTVKNRLHLDVYASSVEDLVALGATVLAPAEETGLGWTLMADPEGGELCCFVREPDALPAYRLHGLGVDCVDAEAQAAWWGRVLGVEPVQEAGDTWWTLEGVGPDEVFTIDFNDVPEPRVGPNRVHLDLLGDRADLLDAGATPLWETEHWSVLADPEGNELCVFAPT